jgi:predicted PurR-regulated permease PerM
VDDKCQNPSNAEPNSHSPLSLLLLGVGLVVALILAWIGRVVLMLLLAAIVVAVLLVAILDWLRAQFRLKVAVAFGLLVAVSFSIVALAVWFLGPSIINQVSDLQTDLPPAWHQLIATADSYRWGRWLLAQWSGYSQLTANVTYALTRIGGMVVGTATILAGLIVVGFLALYLAAEPQLYLSGILRAIPQRYRPIAIACGTNAATFVRWWLRSQLLSMTAVGAIVWIGLLALHVPLAGTLAMIAALFTFIPNIGPILSVFPAALLALAISPVKGLLTLGLFLLVHFLEGNLITPLLERRIVSLPPALTITAQLLLAVIAGPLGLALAAPLTAAALGIFEILLPPDDHSPRSPVPPPRLETSP